MGSGLIQIMKQDKLFEGTCHMVLMGILLKHVNASKNVNVRARSNALSRNKVPKSMLVDDNTRRAINKARLEAQGRVDYWLRALDMAKARFSTPGSLTSKEDVEKTRHNLLQAKEVLTNFGPHIRS